MHEEGDTRLMLLYLHANFTTTFTLIQCKTHTFALNLVELKPQCISNCMIFAYCFSLRRRGPYLLQKSGLMCLGNGSLTQATAASERL